MALNELLSSKEAKNAVKDLQGLGKDVLKTALNSGKSVFNWFGELFKNSKDKDLKSSFMGIFAIAITAIAGLKGNKENEDKQEVNNSEKSTVKSRANLRAQVGPVPKKPKSSTEKTPRKPGELMERCNLNKKYSARAVTIGGDSTSILTSFTLAKLAGRPKNYYRNKEYVKGARRTVDYTGRLKALESNEEMAKEALGQNYELLLYGGGINDIMNHARRACKLSPKRQEYLLNMVVTNILASHGNVIEFAHDRNKKVVLSKLHHLRIKKEPKGWLKNPIAQKFIAKAIDRVNEGIDNLEPKPDGIINPDKLPDYAFNAGDPVHFNKKGSDLIMKAFKGAVLT